MIKIEGYDNKYSKDSKRFKIRKKGFFKIKISLFY